MAIVGATALAGGAAVLIWAIASGGLDNNSEPEAVEITSPASTGTPTAHSPGTTATQTGAPSDTAIVYTEFGQDQDSIWIAPLADLEGARLVATVTHAAFWGITGSVSPDGRKLAYTVLPPTVVDAEVAAGNEAEVWLLSFDNGETSKVADGADATRAPLWIQDRRTLVIQQVLRDSNITRLLSVNLEDKSVTPITSMSSEMPLFLLAPSPSGEELYVGRGGAANGELLSVTIADGSTEVLSSISGEFARGWTLSPEGDLSVVGHSSNGEWSPLIVDLDDGSARVVQADGLPVYLELFSPVWHPERNLLAVGAAPGNGRSGIINVPVDDGPAQQILGPDVGFDVPVAWSPAGDQLVVREFAEYPVRQRERLRLVSLDGQRQPLGGDKEVTFAGWAHVE